MKNIKKKRANPIMVKVVIITLLIVGTMFGTIVMLLIRMEEKRKIADEEMRIREAEIVERAENYLENKYGKKFSVNPDGFSDSGSFIPGKVENKYKLCYEASSLEDPNYVFRVYFDIDTNKNQYSEQIRDNYCWKYLREMLKAKIETDIDLSSEKYKIRIRLYPDVTFNNNITPNSTIEDYFKNPSNNLVMVISIFTYADDIEVEKIKEEKLSLLFNNLKDESESLRVYCTYFVVENKEDFDYINILKVEESDLKKNKDNQNKAYESIKSIEKKEKFNITTSN